MTKQTEDGANESYENLRKRERAKTEPCPAPESLEAEPDRKLDNILWDGLDRYLGEEAAKAVDRKDTPIAAGFLDYFPDAIREASRLSKLGNEKHNPGEPLHWSQDKSIDHADCILRHQIDVGTYDPDWGDAKIDHAVSVFWRAGAQLQMLMQSRGAPMPKGAK